MKMDCVNPRLALSLLLLAGCGLRTPLGKSGSSQLGNSGAGEATSQGGGPGGQVSYGTSVGKQAPRGGSTIGLDFPTGGQVSSGGQIPYAGSLGGSTSSAGGVGSIAGTTGAALALLLVQRAALQPDGETAHRRAQEAPVCPDFPIVG